MSRIYCGLLWKISYNSKIHTCYKLLHRGPSNICCGAKQSCLQMIIAALLKQLGGISDSTDRGMHLKTLRAIYSKLINHPPKWQSFSKVTRLHGLTKFNPISYLLINFHFWSAGMYSVCIMEDNTRLLHCSRLKFGVISAFPHLCGEHYGEHISAFPHIGGEIYIYIPKYPHVQCDVEEK